MFCSQPFILFKYNTWHIIRFACHPPKHAFYWRSISLATPSSVLLTLAATSIEHETSIGQNTPALYALEERRAEFTLPGLAKTLNALLLYSLPTYLTSAITMLDEAYQSGLDGVVSWQIKTQLADTLLEPVQKQEPRPRSTKSRSANFPLSPH